MASTSAQTAAQDAKKRGNSHNHPLTDKAQNAMHSGVDTLADKAGSAEEKMRDSLHAGAEALSEKQQQIQTAWRQSEVRMFAKRNPLATAGIAFAAGMLLTSFLRRKG